MTEVVKILKGSRSEVLLFALEMPPEQVRFLREEDGALSQLLGLEHIDMNQVEVFNTTDLDGIGLVGYLHDGIGIPLAELEPFEEKLVTLTGHLLLIRARAFVDDGAILTPAAPLSLILRLGETKTNWQPKPATQDAPQRQTPRAARDTARRIGATLFAIVMTLIVLVIYVLAT